MKVKGTVGRVAPVDKYWDNNLNTWVNVYPMHITKGYKRNCGASWNTKSGRTSTAGANYMRKG